MQFSYPRIGEGSSSMTNKQGCGEVVKDEEVVSGES
jgi:hypothetical protein